MTTSAPGRVAQRGAGPPSSLGLRHIGLLEGLPPEKLDELARLCRWRRFLHDEQIISREAADNDVYLIVAGRVRVTTFSASGREVLFGDIHAGQWFGDFAAIDGHPRSADVVAVEETLVATMNPVLFRRLLRESADVCDRVLQRLVGCVRELTERVYDFSTLGVQNRVHAEILRLAHRAGVADNSAVLDPAPRHSDIAAQISTYREQVTRELSALTRQGLLRRADNALVVTDVAKLQRMVDELRRAS